jgi:hypothetical protein
MRQHSSAVPGLDPGTHAQAEHRSYLSRWIAGSSPAMTPSHGH